MGSVGAGGEENPALGTPGGVAQQASVRGPGGESVLPGVGGHREGLAPGKRENPKVGGAAAVGNERHPKTIRGDPWTPIEIRIRGELKKVAAAQITKEKVPTSLFLLEKEPYKEEAEPVGSELRGGLGPSPAHHQLHLVCAEIQHLKKIPVLDERDLCSVPGDRGPAQGGGGGIKQRWRVAGKRPPPKPLLPLGQGGNEDKPVRPPKAGPLHREFRVKPARLPAFGRQTYVQLALAGPKHPKAVVGPIQGGEVPNLPEKRDSEKEDGKDRAHREPL